MLKCDNLMGSRSGRGKAYFWRTFGGASWKMSSQKENKNYNYQNRWFTPENGRYSPRKVDRDRTESDSNPEIFGFHPLILERKLITVGSSVDFFIMSRMKILEGLLLSEWLFAFSDHWIWIVRICRMTLKIPWTIMKLLWGEIRFSTVLERIIHLNGRCPPWGDRAGKADCKDDMWDERWEMRDERRETRDEMRLRRFNLSFGRDDQTDPYLRRTCELKSEWSPSEKVAR
jgi:hypothetical protein